MLPAIAFYATLIMWFLHSAGDNSTAEQNAVRVVPMENQTENQTENLAATESPDTSNTAESDNNLNVTDDSAPSQGNVVADKPHPVDSDNDNTANGTTTQNLTKENPDVSPDATVADSDQDGVADHADLCPDSVGVSSNRGCPADTDSDGLPDAQDQCPDQAGTLSSGGCPVDSDADGLPDGNDRCPNTAGDADVQGCPREITTLDAIASQIVFDSASSRLSDKSKHLLTQAARVLNRYPTIHITVAGHTDDQGDESINLKLSEQRARACLNFLVKQGIDSKRMTAIGYGESLPLVPNTTAAARDQNRRVEFIPG